MTDDEQFDRRGDLSLVVPLYNERDRFAESCDALMAFVTSFGERSELVLVDDGSTDGTSEVVEKWIAESGSPHGRLLTASHHGKGAAVRAGLLSARAEYGGFCDIDLSTPLDDLARVAATARRTQSLAVGSRALEGSRLLQRQHPVRERMGRLYNVAVRATVIDGVRDTQCGAKVAPSAVWRRILDLSHEQGFAFDVETVAIAQRLGVRVDEVPVTWTHDRRTRVRVVRDGLGLVAAIPRIFRRVRSIRG